MENTVKRSIHFPKRLSRLSRSIVALVLCFALVLGYSYKEPVKADALAVGAAVIGGAVITAAVIGAIGIGVSANMNNESYTDACNQAWNQAKSNFEGNAANIGKNFADQFTVVQNSSGLVVHAAKDAITELVKSFSNVYPQSTNVTSTDLDFLNKFGLSQYGTNVVSVGGIWSGGLPVGSSISRVISIGSFSGLQFNETANYTIGAVTLSILLSSSEAFKVSYGSTVLADISWDSIPGWVKNSPNDKAPVSFFLVQALTGAYYLYMLTPLLGNSTVSPAWAVASFSLSAADGEAAMQWTGQDCYIPAIENLFADGFSVMNHSLNDVIGKIGALQGIQDGINIRLGDLTGTIEAINDEIKSWTQSKLIDLDISDSAEKEANAEKNTGRDTTPPKAPSMPDLTLPTGLNKKFPFCLPWDLVACYKLFQVPAKAPTWSIPVNIDVGYIKVHQTYTYDMNSNGVMDTVLPIFKWFLNISVIIGLIAITRKIMS